MGTDGDAVRGGRRGRIDAGIRIRQGDATEVRELLRYFNSYRAGLVRPSTASPLSASPLLSPSVLPRDNVIVYRSRASLDDENALPIENGHMLSSEFTLHIRLFAPLCIPNSGGKAWTAVPQDIQTKINMEVMSKFEADWDDPRWKSVLYETAQKCYSNLRSKYHQRFKKYGRNNCPKELLNRINDWFDLCDFFETNAEFQKNSKTYMENRAKMQYRHLGGTRSFMYHKRRLGITDDIDLYKRMYSKNNKWVCGNAREKYEKMLELQNSNNQDESGEALTPRKIMTKILGKKSGYICGLGRAGPRTKSKNSSCSGSCSSSAANSQLAEMQQKYDDLQKKLNMLLAEKELEQRQQPEPPQQHPYVQQLWMQPRRQMGPLDHQPTHNWYQQPSMQHQSEVGATDPYGTQHWHGYNGLQAPRDSVYRPDYLSNYNVYPTQQQLSQDRSSGGSRNGDLLLRGPSFRPDYHPTYGACPKQQHSPQDRCSGSRNGDPNV